MNELAARIEASAEVLTSRVLAEMYADPFWRARFGERADKHGRQDGMFHIKYLGEALRANDASVMAQYARWLQQVLTTRGMCTRHLDENFERLAAAIADAFADSGPALEMLDAARAALLYEDGPARRLQDASATITHALAPRLGVPERDVVQLLSYAADSLALAMPTVLTGHVAWLADHGTPAAHEQLVAIRAACAERGIALP